MYQTIATVYYRSALVIVLGILCFVCGCEDKNAYKTVNFTQITPVGRIEPAAPDKKILTVAIAAMISPKETFSNYYKIMAYISEKIDCELKLIQRKTYAEINELFRKGEVDLAFICTGPYAAGKDAYGFEAVATPIVRGEPFYQAYLIVQADSVATKLEDLKGHVFAFTDPESNTGAAIPTFWLSELNEMPEIFFSRVHYTYSHDNSILAVARSLVHGASVDGHIWEYYHARNPVNTSKTRVIRKSAYFGSPPFVVSRLLAIELKEQIRNILFEMHREDSGKKILDALMIDRFEPANEEWYRTAREIRHRIGWGKNEE